MTFYEELVAIVGRDSALQLLAKYHGRVLYLPKLTGYQGAKSDTRKILDLHSEGNSLTLIAREMALTVTTVIDVLEESLTFHANTSRDKFKK